jgi:uncharacterized protein YtpQ (UPF0354 family)
MDRLLQRNCTRDEFILLYSKLLQERLPGYTIQFTAESLLYIVSPEGKEQACNLDNLWLRYSKSLEDRRDLLEGFVKIVATAYEYGHLKRENIVAIVTNSSYLSLQNANRKLMTEHLCGDLWIVYALDEPDRIKTLGPGDVITAAVSEAELRTLAVENLRRILPQIECHGAGPWYLLTAGTGYAASLLLFDDIWESLKDSVDGDIVATVPSRDVLMYTGSKSAEGISFIRKRSEEIAKNGPYAISDSLIVREGGKWAIFNAN